jgi:predicted O-methyltransferase YrrM
MTNRSLNLDQPLYQYLLDVSLRETALLQQLRAETAQLAVARWQIAPEQGQFMALLIKLIGAKRVLEIGTFTGYSSLCMASAMAEDSLMVCCDTSQEYTDIARRYWRQAGVEERIELRLAPALQSMTELERSGHSESFDLIFIDADKANYLAYLEHALVLLRRGGVLLFDNTLWSGRVLETLPESADTQAIQTLNRRLKNDQRVDLSLLPIGDGLTLCRKR